MLTKRLKETSTQSRKKYRASGYVSKQEMSETVLIAIRRLLDGEKYLSPNSHKHFQGRWGLTGLAAIVDNSHNSAGDFVRFRPKRYRSETVTNR